MFWIYSLLGGLKMGKPKLKKEIGLFTATALVVDLCFQPV